MHWVNYEKAVLYLEQALERNEAPSHAKAISRSKLCSA